MDFTALVFCLFLLHCQAEGDVREETLYVKTGTDLLLDVGEHVAFKKNDQMLWKFNITVNIVQLTHTNEPVPFGIYKGRAELIPQNQSLLLKNVQKTDSGEYRVEGFINFINRVLVKYQVRVLDPVSDVKLEVKQCSSDRSDLTVTCTTLDDLLNSTFICNNTTCSHEGGEKNIPPGASMKVYLKNGSVTCHHSNQVSSKEDTRTIKDLCDPVSDVKVYLKNGSVTSNHRNQVSSKENTKTIEDPYTKDHGESAPKANPLTIYVTVTVTLVILLITCVALAVYCRQRQKGETEEVKDPVYADVSRALKQDQRPRPGPRNDAHAESPDVIYSAVASHRTAPTETPTEPIIQMQPESCYATVKKTRAS